MCCGATLCRNCPVCPHCQATAQPCVSTFPVCVTCGEPYAPGIEDDHAVRCLSASVALSLWTRLQRVYLQETLLLVPLTVHGWVCETAPLRATLLFVGHGLVMTCRAVSGARVGQLTVWHAMRNARLHLVMTGPNATTSTLEWAVAKTVLRAPGDPMTASVSLNLDRVVWTLGVSVVASIMMPLAIYRQQSACAWRLGEATNFTQLQYLAPPAGVQGAGLSTSLHLLLAQSLAAVSPAGHRLIWRVAMACLPYFYFITEQTAVERHLECILCGRVFLTPAALAACCLGISPDAINRAVPMKLDIDTDHMRVSRLDPGVPLDRVRPADLAEYYRFHWSCKGRVGLQQGVLPLACEPLARLTVHPCRIPGGRATTLEAYLGAPIPTECKTSGSAPYLTGETIFDVVFTPPLDPLEAHADFPAFILSTLVRHHYPKLRELGECMVFDVIAAKGLPTLPNVHSIARLSVATSLRPQHWNTVKTSTMTWTPRDTPLNEDGRTQFFYNCLLRRFERQRHRTSTVYRDFNPETFVVLRSSAERRHTSYTVRYGDATHWPTFVVCRW